VADPDRDDQEVLPGLDPRVRKRVVSQEAQTANVRKMLHRGGRCGSSFSTATSPPTCGATTNTPARWIICSPRSGFDCSPNSSGKGEC